MALNDRSKIVEKNIEEEMKTSYIDYSMSVIVSRALPDVRDGLKPSQRRILVAMNDLNLAPGRPYRKCAKIAGDTSGNYHPHGEQVVYPTLVRLAQSWVMRYPLVDGQGNFGSIDGDAPAAMRYTEARLTPLAVEMLADLEKNTVDFRSNYDETREEPTVLPGVLPNLLVNGCSGIAVGMATEVPPHNLTEVCEAIIQLIERPEITPEELLKIVTGPDFPTGGIIYGTQGIRDCYLTGRGLIRMRAQVQVEEGRAGRLSLVATQIPFQVNKSMLLERIADMVRDSKLTGISDLRDESDRDGMRIVIELKKDANPKVVLNQLFVHTPLQSTFGAIMLGLVNNRPQVLTLRALLDQYVLHRKVV
ncbi:MAG: DNA gyrase subunit A, partial [Candidatus Eiseniibacteriota bacterium]